MKWITVGLYLGSVVLANWLVDTVGIIPIGFGLMAPAGVFAIGITLSLRDEVHDLIGVRGSIFAILAGAAVSVLISPVLALASATAFLVSEGADLAVYTPLRQRSKTIALLLSNTVGLVVDSVIFLSLAFGSLQFLPGQIVGKFYATLAAVLFVWWRRSRSEVLSRNARHLMAR